MHQFDVCVNGDRQSAARYPYLLVVQTELLAALATRVVVPLALRSSFGGRPIGRLMPEFNVEGQGVVAVVPELAGVAAHRLGEVVAHVGDRRSDILAALDLLLTGV